MYRSNIYMTPTYIYIYIYTYTLIDKLNLKISFKMLSEIGLIISFVLPIYHNAATGFLFLSSLSSNQGHTNKQVSSLVDSLAYNPLV